MPILLSAAQQERLLNQLRQIFSDVGFFNELVTDKLKQAIADSTRIDINSTSIKKVAERYYIAAIFDTPELKVIWARINVIFKSCYVLILAQDHQGIRLMWPSVERLLETYPSFAEPERDEEELRLLLNFRNMLRVAITLLPPRHNKKILITIAGRLEGSQNEYITGSGQRLAVDRRVDIYETEGGIRAESRPERARPVTKTPEPKKRIRVRAVSHASFFSTESQGEVRKKYSPKAIKLSAAEIVRLTQTSSMGVTSITTAPSAAALVPTIPTEAPSRLNLTAPLVFPLPVGSLVSSQLSPPSGSLLPTYWQPSFQPVPTPTHTGSSRDAITFAPYIPTAVPSTQLPSWQSSENMQGGAGKTYVDSLFLAPVYSYVNAQQDFEEMYIHTNNRPAASSTCEAEAGFSGEAVSDVFEAFKQPLPPGIDSTSWRPPVVIPTSFNVAKGKPDAKDASARDSSRQSIYDSITYKG